ncbi:molybdopterin-binding protein [Glutamicibacter sp. MNS18]|uniref:molybdopterin-binding protein n=1 Tax=Glutamicibacter sp. MNS18 TaxID=2989817 RepID=UPI002235AC26|nr:molybdopterin-binding protein [Glutamicibacter sp. MNS18]MCW4466912.1 molybdopterin-binding protein [Glutamicibacter sp. MNS18]
MTDPTTALRRAGVLVASTSAAAGTNPDRTGPVISQWLQQRGFAVNLRLTADGPEVGAGLRELLAGEPRLILTTGGTGVSPTDLTPEQTAPLLQVQLPGIIEAIRRRGEAMTPLSVLTRGVAGFAGSCLIVNLPGSTGGVRDGLAVLDPLLEHLLEQRITGGGHGPRH